jgi:hypothetical protein
MLPFAVGGKNQNLPQVSSFSIALESKQFDPEKHAAICQELAKAYAHGGTPLKMLEGFLSILTLASFADFSESQFDAADAKKSCSPVGWLIELFGVEVVLIWTAMLLKKRVVVFSNKVVEMQRLLRALPALVWHRDNWNVLRPYCIVDDDLDDLQGGCCLLWPAASEFLFLRMRPVWNHGCCPCLRASKLTSRASRCSVLRGCHGAA